MMNYYLKVSEIRKETQELVSILLRVKASLLL